VLPAKYFRSALFHWNADTNVPTCNASSPLIEFIASPNNPDGERRTPRAMCYNAMRVIDHAYYWPHFVAIDKIVNYDHSTVALFTLSKLSGHASTRIGWAITGSATLASAMKRWISTSHIANPYEAQVRAANLIESISFRPTSLFSFARKQMVFRWEVIVSIFSKSRFWHLQERDVKAYDTFFERDAYTPSPAYAWVEYLGEDDAFSLLKSVGVLSIPGTQYGSSTKFARLSLLSRSKEFALLAARLQKLVDSENKSFYPSDEVGLIL